ncbi:hypothetical protein COL30_14480 [Bacillus pseudomycoides]|uniref:Uncharacterized protein n=1 Tax=Bacillus pseudomycoides TaxID=64104 RepID=A0A2C3ZU07_9BACI|nr:hypothetical protein CON79_09825 [Bacillus pseudomycoides]PED07869.1 hypothetical protein COO19_13895 [Bacillus pseudomycoides]PED72189.1 hypothetical protein CON97_10355 [Bacillus pseudomycoides]PEI44457.1 hypothetical protein CN620_05280 [Bacillus pseudomycoides]PEJ77464.1 hypothetical protein CN680_15405 [Bacillus pseudomycoides]
MKKENIFKVESISGSIVWAAFIKINGSKAITKPPLRSLLSIGPKAVAPVSPAKVNAPASIIFFIIEMHSY